MSSEPIKQRYQDAGVAYSYDAARFSSLAGRVFDLLEKRTLRRVLNRVRRDVAQPQVLDIPCGTGRITELLVAEGLTVTGGDISIAMMDVARRKCARYVERIAFRQLDLDQLDLPDDSFDVVTCIRLFHHLNTQARERILHELARVTRTFVVFNCSLSSPWHRLRRCVKRRFGQGVSAESSSWTEIVREARSARLCIEKSYAVIPYVSEDLVLLARKQAGSQSRGRVAAV